MLGAALTPLVGGAVWVPLRCWLDRCSDRLRPAPTGSDRLPSVPTGSDPLRSCVSAFADAATAPADYCVAPALAIPKVLQQAGMTAGDVDRWEINEAFSIVVIVCSRILDLDPDKVNVHGGAVSIGHPIG